MGRKTNAAVTAGLVAVLSLGQMPTVAVAESLGLEATPATTAATPDGAAAIAAGTSAAATSTGADAASTAGAGATAAATTADTTATATPTVESVPAPLALSTTQGEPANLPQNVDVTMSDGTSKQLAVTWKLKGQEAPVDTAALTPGAYELAGTLDGSDQTASAMLTVTEPAESAAAETPQAATPVDAEKQIVSIERYDMQTSYAVGALNVDAVRGVWAKVTYADGSDDPNVWVPFQEEDVANIEKNADKPGVYTLTGKLEGSDCTVSVTIRILKITSVNPYTVRTKPGVAPKLDDYAWCTLEDGNSAYLLVEWDKIESSQYAQQGIIKVLGAVRGTDIKAVATVYVSNIKSVTGGNYAAAVVGYPQSLRRDIYNSVTVNYELGGSDQANVTWNYPADDDPCWQKPGTFTIEGTVEGIDQKAKMTVELVDPKLIETQPTARAVVGSSFYSGTQVTTKGSSTHYLEVDWEYGWDVFAKPGTVAIYGTVRGTDIPVTLTVTVAGIKSIEKLDPIETLEGIVPSWNDYPHTVLVEYTDGVKDTQSVSRYEVSISPVELAAGKTVTVQGKVGNTGATVPIDIKAVWTMPYKGSVNVSTAPGVAPNLPSKVTGTLANGTSKQVSVDWETPLPGQYAKVGNTFTVQGVLSGSRHKVTATVKVLNVVDGTQIDVVTAPGIAPTMYNPTMALEDGSELHYDSASVLWDTPEPAQYAKAGTEFSVDGKVVGTGISLKANVAVSGVARIEEQTTTYLISGSGETAVVSSDLPTSVFARLDNGELMYLPVEWESTDDVFKTPGKKTLVGVIGTSRVEQDITVLAVAGAKLSDAVNLLYGTADAGETTHFYWSVPATITVDDGSGKLADRSWADCMTEINVEKGQLREAGVHEVPCEVVVGNVRIPSTCTINVHRGFKDYAVDGVWTLPGCTPSMPGHVVANYGEGVSTGSSSDYLDVEWDAIDPALYAVDKDGTTFTATGKVKGTDVQVKTKVKVASVKSVDMPSSVGVMAGAQYANLPMTAMLNLSDGSTMTAWFATSWISADGYSEGEIRGLLKRAGSSYRMSNVIELPDGTSRQVTCTVNVLAAAKVMDQKDMGYLTTLTTEVGVTPRLPETVPVKLSDGSVTSATVDWDPVDYKDVSKEGTVTVKGRVQGLGGTAAASLFSLFTRSAEPGVVTATVKVVEKSDTPLLSYVEPSFATTTVGGKVDFSEYTVFGANSRGDTVSYPITWDTSTIDYSKPGVYVVYGDIEGSDVKATAYVTVAKAAPTIKSVAEASPIKLEVGATKDNIANLLPSRVAVTLSDGTTSLADVKWIFEKLLDETLLSKPGTIELEGNVTGATAKAKIKITLVAKGSALVTPKAVEKSDLGEVKTQEGKAPALPKTATVVMSDGSTETSDVVWESVGEGLYGKGMAGNSFTVNGQTTLGDFAVTVTVAVEPGEDPEPDPEPEPTPTPKPEEEKPKPKPEEEKPKPEEEKPKPEEEKPKPEDEKPAPEPGPGDKGETEGDDQDETDAVKGDTSKDKGSKKKTKKDSAAKAKLAQTGDASLTTVAATGTAGVASLVGAWFARRRKRDE